MPRGALARSVFRRAFRAKRELHCIFIGKRQSLLHPNTARFFPINYTLFLGKLKEKLALKARLNTARVYRIVLMPPPGIP